MICFRCHKEIKSEEDYYSFTEFHQKEIVKIDYTHRECWENFLKSLTDVTQAKGMIQGLNKTLTKMGVLPEEEFVLK